MKYCPDADCNDDPALVVLWERMKLRPLKKENKTPKYSIQLISNCNDIQEKFDKCVENKLEMLVRRSECLLGRHN